MGKNDIGYTLVAYFKTDVGGELLIWSKTYTPPYNQEVNVRDEKIDLPPLPHTGTLSFGVQADSSSNEWLDFSIDHIRVE